jgi:two-component system, OmpR family, sensor histidine kinase TctE
MIRSRFRSLQFRLAIRLVALYIAATAIAVGILVYQAYDTAGTLDNRELSLRAADLAQYISLDPKGAARLDLPPKLAAAYEAGSGADIFAVRGLGGKIVAASPSSFGELVAGWPVATDDSSYFHLNDFGSGSQDYYGLSISLNSIAGPLSISVARSAGADALMHSLLREFVVDIAWVIPLLVLVTLGIGTLAVRSGLKPVRAVSEMAMMIGPSTTSVRLPDENVPSEITPLVVAVNHAFDRLEQGFAVQRQFTADAAHELRTPLAIMTAALDVMEGNGDLSKLKSDVARMNRLVEQLLRVARLDAIVLDVSGNADLNDVAASIVTTMAPWAFAQERAIAYDGSDQPVQVKGNVHAIEDAIRNLVENAITHSPPRTEVVVSVRRNGSVSVADQGPGISPEDRERIFDRFWRGRGATSLGAGLGLAIVKEIMRVHRGNISVDNNPNGGATFTLCFQLADKATRRPIKAQHKSEM